MFLLLFSLLSDRMANRYAPATRVLFAFAVLCLPMWWIDAANTAIISAA